MIILLSDASKLTGYYQNHQNCSRVVMKIFTTVLVESHHLSYLPHIYRVSTFNQKISCSRGWCQSTGSCLHFVPWGWKTHPFYTVTFTKLHKSGYIFHTLYNQPVGFKSKVIHCKYNNQCACVFTSFNGLCCCCCCTKVIRATLLHYIIHAP